MSPRRQDRTGQAFGKLTVVADSGGELRRRYREMQRRHNATQARRLANDPAAYAAKIEKQRAWYRSLSEADYQRIFVEPSRARARARAKSNS